MRWWYVQVLKQQECMLMDLKHQKTIVWTVAFDFFFILTFESLLSIWKFLIFIFSAKQIFWEIPPKFSKKCWHTFVQAVQKSEKRKAVLAYFNV